MISTKKSREGNREGAAKPLLYVAAGLFFLAAWAGFVITPMAGDIKVFLGSANQSAYISGNLIIGAFQAWELKSVYSRTLMYLLFKIARLFFPFGTLGFEICCKFLYSILVLVLSCLSMGLLFAGERKKAAAATIVAALVFFALHATAQMQVEMTVSLLILLAFSLYVNAIQTQKLSALKLFCAGLLIGATFYFKSVLILLSVTVVAAVCIYLLDTGRKLSLKRMLVVVIGSLVMLGVTLVLILVINPGEIQDILDASAYQQTLFSVRLSPKTVAMTFCKKHVQHLLCLPPVLVGMVSLLINLCACLRRGKIRALLFHLVMWLMPALFILLSNRYFPYHLAAYLFPSLVEIYYAVRNRKGLRGFTLSAAAVLCVLWYLVAFSVVSPNFFTYMRLNLQAYQQTEEVLEEIAFDRRETMLYLDDGSAAYTLGNRSYMKYYYPLPLQRLPEDSALKSHRESLEEVLNYSGKYIVIDENWFYGKDGEKYQNIHRKIEREYRKVGSCTSFGAPTSFLPSRARLSEADLYERK